MKHHARTKAQILKEVETLRQQVEHLEAQLMKYRAAESRLTLLATFPEHNPDILIETDIAGRVTYLNPVAQSRFPELWQDGFAHPLLQGLPPIIHAFENGKQSHSAREIRMGEYAFEEQICYTADLGVVRIRVYVHDITQRVHAEQAIQRLAQRVVYAQEEERQRLSRELHDEAGQALTALKLSLELLQAELPLDTEVLRQNLWEAIALTESTKERIRLLALGLRPPGLDTVGLNLTLEAFCRDFSRRTQISIKYRGVEVPQLSDAMNICLYRILQEALTNIIKHAQADEVAVSLSCNLQTVQLLVADNGRGFDPVAGKSLPEQTAGIGLLGMHERLELLGGWLGVESGAGTGLRLLATLPVGPTV